ncbi:DNA-directed DNA polymerase [Tanacetum coccineum]
MACKRISYLETPARKVGLKNPYLICDYCGGSYEAEECSQNNPAEQVCLSGGDIYDDPSLLRFYQNDNILPWGNNKRKEKGEDGPERIIRKAPTFTITTRSGVSTQDLLFPDPSQSTPTDLAEGATKKEGTKVKKQKKDDEDERVLSIFKQIHINLPFLEAMIHMPKGAKVLKDLLSHNEKLEKAASLVKLSEECSAIIQRSLPRKGDPGSFTLPCLIGPLAVKNALADLGASINLMPHFLFRQLGIPKLKLTQMSIQLAGRSIKYPIGVDIVDHDGEWIEVKEGRDSDEVRAVSFYPSIESVEPLEWKALENLLKLSSVKPPNLELKELPEHLEYAFLQEENQLPVVISSALSTIEKARLLKVLRNHKGAIAWSIVDIKGINSSFCTHKILMEDEFKPSVQPHKRVNPNIKKVVKKEVIKLLNARLIYLVSDSP